MPVKFNNGKWGLPFWNETTGLVSYPGSTLNSHGNPVSSVYYTNETARTNTYDATSINFNDWTTPRYLAIDQGTIAPMIENYRTGLLWDLFMNAPDIRAGLKKIGFKSEKHKID